LKLLFHHDEKLKNTSPYNHARAYQAKLKKQQGRRATAIISFRNGVKAGAKAARELIDEGFGKADDFGSLVLHRVAEHRKRSAENQSAPDAS